VVLPTSNTYVSKGLQCLPGADLSGVLLVASAKLHLILNMSLIPKLDLNLAHLYSFTPRHATLYALIVIADCRIPGLDWRSLTDG